MLRTRPDIEGIEEFIRIHQLFAVADAISLIAYIHQLEEENRELTLQRELAFSCVALTKKQLLEA